MTETVLLKGTRDGVAVLVDPGASFSVLVEELVTKLQSGAEFWAGAQFFMGEIAKNASPEEKKLLENQLHELGIIVTEQSLPKRRQSGPKEAEGKGEAAKSNATMIKRTLRSGQRIEAPGSVIVMGDVNAGAEIIARGDILVLGSLRGVAHAGAQGDTNAVVMAFRLEPTQLRIAHHISRAPDEGTSPTGPEIARVRNERITVERFGG